MGRLVCKAAIPPCIAGGQVHKAKGIWKTSCHRAASFLDASTTGYGQCSYVRLKNSEKQVVCAFIMGKSRVVPAKPVTIPKLKLAAAVVSIKVASVFNQELNFENVGHVYWTDSKVVLGYMSNEARRFHCICCNRLMPVVARLKGIM